MFKLLYGDVSLMRSDTMIDLLETFKSEIDDTHLIECEIWNRVILVIDILIEEIREVIRP